MNAADKGIVQLYKRLTEAASVLYPQNADEALQACDHIIATNLDYRLAGRITYNRETGAFTGFDAEKDATSKHGTKRTAGDVVKRNITEEKLSTANAYRFFYFCKAQSTHAERFVTSAWDDVVTPAGEEDEEKAARAEKEETVNVIMQQLVLRSCYLGVPRARPVTDLIKTMESICSSATKQGLSIADVARIVYAPETIKPA